MACDSQVNICLADASALMLVAMLLVILGWIYVLGWVVLELAKKLAIPPSLLANWATEEAAEEDYWATRTRMTEEDYADYAIFKAGQACIAELEELFAARRAEQLPAPPAAAPPTLLATVINMLRTMSAVLTEEADRGFKALAEEAADMADMVVAARAEVLEWIARALTEDADDDLDADFVAAEGAEHALRAKPAHSARSARSTRYRRIHTDRN